SGPTRPRPSRPTRGRSPRDGFPGPPGNPSPDAVTSTQRVTFVPQIVLGLAASVAIYVAFTLPPKTTQLQQEAVDGRVVAGGYHIHSNRSDGTGAPDDIAAAAARAG